MLDAEAGKFETVNTYTTTNQLVEMWLKEYARNKRDVTVSKVRRFFEMYVLVPQWFDDVEISKISRKSIQEWTDWLASFHATYKKQATYFAKVFDVAVSYELLETNPFNNIRYPTAIAKPDRSYRVEAYDKTQLEAFIKALLDKYDNNEQFHKYAYLRLLAFTGMRNGEARALQWDDIHLDGNEPYIDVNKTMSDVTGKGVVVNAPKTKAGNRTVKLDPITTQALRRWRAIQGQRLMHRGLAPNVVWTNQRLTNRISSNQPREWLLSAIRGTNVPLINIHGLRHTYITLAVEANIPIKALQAQVGHDDINTTLGVYTAVTKDMRAKTTELFTSLVNF